MKMIWPGRALGVAFLLPALLSLSLFLDDRFVAIVVIFDLAVAALALFDLFTLWGAGRISVERHLNAVCSLDEPGSVELVLENLGRARRFLTVRDDVPDEFIAEPASFEVKLPGHRKVMLAYQFTPKKRGTYRFERVDALVFEPAGLLALVRGRGRSSPRSGFIPTSTRSSVIPCWRAAIA